MKANNTRLMVDDRYDRESFLKVVKEAVTNKLQSHRQTKVKMILKCMMKETNMAVHPVDHNAERITKELREQAETLNWEGINFPSLLKDITKFEKQNPSISVNVFG